MIVNVTVQVKAESLAAGSGYVEALLKQPLPDGFKYPRVQNEGKKVVKAEEVKR